MLVKAAEKADGMVKPVNTNCLFEH